ncbi:GNAT family N-acetyltransferase [bacterium]|nr:GNAT family N-acetyltransferase [bacterium]
MGNHMFQYRAELKGGLVVTNTRPEHAEQLQQLQDTVFPTLAPEERFRAVHYRKHLELFPEGQFVVLDGDRVIGMTSNIRLDFDFDHPNHAFADVIQGGFLTSHDPRGRWLYGADIGTHPDYRGRGVARGIYAALDAVVAHLRLAGQVKVGMPSGYGARKHEMTPEEYYRGLEQGTINDPTVSVQVHMGFAMRGLLRGYLNDPVCDNCGVLLVKEAG